MCEVSAAVQACRYYQSRTSIWVHEESCNGPHQKLFVVLHFAFTSLHIFRHSFCRETFAPKPTKPARGRPFPAKKPSLCATATIPSMLSSELPELCKVASKARTKLAEDTVSPISTTWAKRSPQNKVQCWFTKLTTDGFGWVWEILGLPFLTESTAFLHSLYLFISFFPSCVFETVWSAEPLVAANPNSQCCALFRVPTPRPPVLPKWTKKLHVIVEMEKYSREVNATCIGKSAAGPAWQNPERYQVGHHRLSLPGQNHNC